MDASSVTKGGSHTGAQWTLRLLGRFALISTTNQQPVHLPGKRERILLAWLALSPTSRSSRRKLATLLWGESDDNASLDNLRVCLWGLRKALGDAEHRVVTSQGEDIILDLTTIDVDVLAFRRLAAAAGKSELEEAATLFVGEFLDGLSIGSEEFEAWRRDEAVHCREQAIDLFLRLMAAEAAAGDIDRAINAGLRILRLDPLHEPAGRQVMQLYARSGRRGAATQLYRTLAEALKSELGVLPEPETRATLAEITRGSEGEMAEPTSRSATTPPFTPVISVTHTADAQSNDPQLDTLAVAVTPPRSWWYHGRAIAAGVTAVIITATAVYQFAPRTRNAQTEIGVTDTAPRANTVSIAVLPFANLSGDSNQQFFSDGMTEEVTAALAKIPGLQIVARTSAFQFRNSNRDIQAIGQQLHASHVIEGSVRKDGERVRIAVQLISATDGKHVWAEEYDRRLVDIFATEEDIARMVAASVSKPLGLKPGENLVNNRPKDTTAYDEFLRAKALWWERGRPQMLESSGILERVVVRVPDYAPAWSQLALAYVDIPSFEPAFYSGVLDGWRSVMDSALQKSETAAQRALQLDPKNADAWLVLAKIQLSQNKYARADELNARALALDPDDADALINRNQLLHDMGYLKEALVLSQRAVVLEPYVTAFKLRLALDLWLNGRSGESIGILQPLVADGKTPFAAWALARIYAEQGRFDEAADALLKTPKGTFLPGTVETAVQLMRGAPASKRPDEIADLGALDWAYFFVGAPDHALDWNEHVQKIGYWAMVWPFWGEHYASLRKTDQFKSYLRSLGFVEYWRQHGWPDLCHSAGADDFACN